MGKEPGVVMRWETARRYYAAAMYQDLLGDWVVTRVWGGKFNRLGGTETTPVKDQFAALETLMQVAGEREKRHYRLVGSSFQ